MNEENLSQFQRTFATLAGISGFVTVALGAFGAHGLKDKLSPLQMDIYHTAVLYQMFHTLALLGVSQLLSCWRTPKLLWGGWFFIGGILLFSGSLYLLAVIRYSALGMVTPLGGICFLMGWLCIALAAIKPV